MRVLKKQAKKIIDLYIKKINSTNDLTKLNKIYSSFENNVKIPL
jgi:hypothetical protein